jgi:hypothetical protein
MVSRPTSTPSNAFGPLSFEANLETRSRRELRLYQVTLAYQEWLDLESTPIKDAVPHILNSLA